MSAQWLTPIPIGNAVCVNAVSSDALTATRNALVLLTEEVNTEFITHLTLSTCIVEPTADDCWETTVYAHIAE
jgi:hypothetical protein